MLDAFAYPFPSGLALLRLTGEADASLSLEKRASRGDRGALEALLHTHAPAIVRLCRNLNGDTDGLDAGQEALERIVVGIESYDPQKAAFRTWAFAVARNACRDRLRRRGLERAAFASDGDPHVAAAMERAPDPERATLLSAETGRLERALATLPEEMRAAIVLFHVQEASYEEIAATLDVPMGTVMTWLHRGRKRLRAILEGAS